MRSHWDLAGDQIQGARPRQEDALRLVEAASGIGEAPVLVVADGMGGHVGGAEASRVAADAFVAALSIAGPGDAGPTGTAAPSTVEERLAWALERANEAVADVVRARPELGGMGTTLVGVRCGADGLHWASVGDSPLWLWREGRLLRLNADHSLAGILREEVAQGRRSPAKAADDAARHILQAAVMGEPLAMRDVASHPLVAGDIVVLASDGIETLPLGELEALVAAHRHATADAIAHRILEEIERRDEPRQDNATVVVAKR